MRYAPFCVVLLAFCSPLTVAADETKTGPAFITLTDPDGNPILIDQHVPRPNTPRK